MTREAGRGDAMVVLVSDPNDDLLSPPGHNSFRAAGRMKKWEGRKMACRILRTNFPAGFRENPSHLLYNPCTLLSVCQTYELFKTNELEFEAQIPAVLSFKLCLRPYQYMKMLH